MWVLAAALSAGLDSASAQAPASPPTTSAVPASTSAAIPPSDQQPAPVVEPTGDGVRLAANTPIRVELTELVSSKDRTRGDKFAIRLAAPIVVDGRTLASAGATGMGEVVYAERGGGGGSPGKLVLAARYLDVGDVRVRLKAFNLSAGGEQEFTEMQVAAEIIGPGVMFINGHNVVYPAGTRAGAKVAEDVVIPAGPASAKAAEPPTAPLPTPPPPTPAASSTAPI